MCVAVLMAASTKEIAGKTWAIFFPILAFVISGFEHCVANMYYIPIGIMAATNSEYVSKAREIYGVTVEQLATLNVIDSLQNFIPVTIGNLVGGAACVGSICYVIHQKLEKKN